MQSQTPKIKKPGSKWLRRAVIAGLALLLGPIILFGIGWFSRDLLIDELQDWYNENNNGSLEIGQVDASFISGFPNVGFSIKDIRQTGLDTILDKRSEISIKNTQVSIAALDLLRGEVQFRNIEIYDANIHTEVVTNKTVAEYRLLKESKQSNPNIGLKLPRWLHQKHTNFRLNNVHFIAKDSILNKYFNIEVQKIQGRIRSEDQQIKGKLDFRLTGQALSFNTEKGSYLNGAVLTGSPDFVLDQNLNILRIPEFPLAIGEQTFFTEAEFDFNGVNAYKFKLSNPETNFQQLRKLLPQQISEKLDYRLQQPLSSGIELAGKFRYGDVPFIDGKFSTSNNQIIISDSIQMTRVNFEGYITNSLTDNSASDSQFPLKRDIRIFFNEFDGNIEDIKVSAKNSYYQSSMDARNYIEAYLKMNGSNITLASVMDTDNFNFIGGNFKLDTHISGDISDPQQVFDYAVGNFQINDTRVVLKQNNLQLPVEQLRVALNNKKAALEQLKINLPNGEDLNFEGSITNISSLLADEPGTPAKADVILKSDKLDINALVATTMEFIPSSEKERDHTKTLNQTFEAIYKKFRPRFRLDMKEVLYDSLSFQELQAEVLLSNAETLKLDHFNFNYKNSENSLKGTLRIPKTNDNYREPLFLNILARSSGPIKAFQELFNISLVDIKGGDFIFEGNISGNLQKFDQILNQAKGDLSLKNAQFFYPEADLEIELDSLKVAVQDSNIRLEPFKIEIGDHHPVALRGKVTNFPGFLLDNSNSNGKIQLGLDAEIIDIDYWLETVNSFETDTTGKTIQNKELAVILADIYRFNPEFSLKVDTLKYQKLVSRDIATRVYFENDSILRLDDFRIGYKDSEAKIRGKLTAHPVAESGNENPFNFEINVTASGNSVDLNDLLKTVNFDLRSGNFKFNGSYKGEASDLKIMNSNARGELSLGATLVDITGTEIQIPVDSLQLNIKNNLASLERLDVELPGKSSIDISGAIDNFSNFINNEQAVESHRSSFHIRSPYLDKKDIIAFIGSSEKKKDSLLSNPVEINKIKDVLSNIYKSYYPSARLEIDSLVYDKIAISALDSEIGFNESGDIRIYDTGFKYHKATAMVSLQAGLKTSEELPVDIEMEIQDMDLKKLVEDLDYFKNESLQQAEKINGNLDLAFNLTGTLDEQGQVDQETLNGEVSIGIKDLALHEYQPLLDKVKVLKEERFRYLEFQPIQQTFQVVAGKIRIPRTQIQSTALHFFVEGDLEPGKTADIWISVPWNNLLKSRNGIALPSKVSFENSGAKFYIQMVKDQKNDKDEKSKLKTRFRLSNRKLRKSKKED